MPQQEYFIHTLKNGMVLVAEPMAGVESAAFSFLVPAGTIYEPRAELGLAAVTCDMLLRGCGDRDARQFLSELEILGVQRGESVSASHTSYGGATVPKTSSLRCRSMQTCCVVRNCARHCFRQHSK